jgi:hypothetical protein
MVMIFLRGHENILRVAKRAEESGIAALALMVVRVKICI